VRYYWGCAEILNAIDRLMKNLVEIPESMLSRYLFAQYQRLREQQISVDPESLVLDRIRDVLRSYAAACVVQ
jgi:D-tagatose-1,6-bisphosphate aldolase subunit GatZ/KbaZ